MRTLLPIIFVLILKICCSQYTENVLIQPLADLDKTAIFFKFDINEDTDFVNYNLFPKSIGNILKNNFIEEFHLSLTRGRWKYDHWGLPYYHAASGAELRAHFNREAASEHGLDSLWKKSTYSLSGLFCSSLEYMSKKHNDSDQFVKPFRLYRPEAQIYDGDVLFSSKSNQTVMRHAILEGEIICTENLTPWIKMLPDRAKSGISKLLASPWTVLHTDYQSLGVHYDKSSNNLYLTLTIVVNEKKAFNNGNIFKNFETESIQASPISKKSVVSVVNNPNYEFIVGDDYVGEVKGNIKSYTLKDIPFRLRLNRIKRYPPNKIDWIKVNRWTVGWGQQYGTLSLLLENNLNKTLDFVYFQSTPWIMRLYFHTMKFNLNGKILDENHVGEIIRFNLKPAVDRERPNEMEFFIKLKASDKLLITIDYDKTHLHWTEYPHAALKGFDINSGILSVRIDKELRDYLLSQQEKGYVFGFSESSSKSNDVTINIYSDSILFTLAIPDFSMPYNVIILSSTAIAIFFGSVLSTLTRKYRDIYKSDSFHSDKLLVVIFRKIRGLFKKD